MLDDEEALLRLERHRGPGKEVEGVDIWVKGAPYRDRGGAWCTATHSYRGCLGTPLNPVKRPDLGKAYQRD